MTTVDPACRIEVNLDTAHAALRELAALGIAIDVVTQQLEDEGVIKFLQPYEATMDA